jgi:beta-mannosidase
MYPHRIRLHGPWQFEPLARTAVHADGRIEQRFGPVPPPGRMRIPTTSAGTVLDGFRGRVRWRRDFHWPPRTLEPHERLWLAFYGVDYFADVALNDVPLGRHEGYFDPFEFEATGLIGRRNELVVDVDCPAEMDACRPRMIRGTLETHAPGFVGGLWRDVTLQVRSVAFLRHVGVQAHLDGSRGTITVTGQVVGDTTARLGLDLSVDGSWLAGQEAEPSPSGAAFHIEATIDPAELWWPSPLGRPRLYTALLELHGNARTLDSVERRLGFRRLVIDPRLTSLELNDRRVEVRHSDLEITAQPLGVTSDAVERLTNNSVHDARSVDLVRVAGRVVGRGLYDAADERGILLWQDFPLCENAPTDPACRDEAVRQAEAMVRQLGSHPSIALWSCHAGGPNQASTVSESIRTRLAALDPAPPPHPNPLPLSWGERAG